MKIGTIHKGIKEYIKVLIRRIMVTEDDLYRCIECWKLSRIREDKTIPICNQCNKKENLK